MKEKLVIIGAGGHGKVCAGIAELMGYKEIKFLDDNPEVAGTLGTTELLPGLVAEYDVFVAVGSNAVRKMLTERAKSLGADLATLVHPNAVVSKYASVGEGTVVMAGAVINPGAEIGRGAIVNTCGSVDHDCRVGDFAHIAVGAHLTGTVEVGAMTLIGAGATVINNLRVCENCIIGAGAVVIRNISEPGTYVGVPVRKIK